MVRDAPTPKPLPQNDNNIITTHDSSILLESRIMTRYITSSTN